jgi:hypothetical protein
MRKRIAGISVAVLAVACIGTAVAVGKPAAKTATFTATLNIAQEVPKETGAPAMAAGKFTATLTGTTLKWSLTFSHLTGAATAAHIHMGAKGKPGAVIVALCGPCKSPASGTAKVSAAVVKAMSGGQAYVNVHTAKNPGGEIRGQVM